MVNAPLVVGQPVSGRRLHEAVVEQLTRQIVGGALPPGTLLPAEPRLAQQFGASRMTIREAVRLLAAKGLVAVKHGSGVRVRPPDAWDRLDVQILFEQVQVSRDPGALEDVLEARRLIEPELADLAATRRDEADLDALGEAVAAMRAAQPGARFGEWDTRFHHRVYAAARNPVLAKTAVPVQTVLFGLRGLLTARRAGHIAESQRGHEAIFDAIRRGDGAAARDAMRDHVRLFEADLRQSDLFRR